MGEQLANTAKGAFDRLFEQLMEGHEKFLMVGRTLCLQGKENGDTIKEMQKVKPDMKSYRDIAHTLQLKGMKISHASVGVYLKLSNNWAQICAEATEQDIDLGSLGPWSALRLIHTPQPRVKPKALPKPDEWDGWKKDGTRWVRGNVSIKPDEDGYYAVSTDDNLFSMRPTLPDALEVGNALASRHRSSIRRTAEARGCNPRLPLFMHHVNLTDE
jgi:hypothetical protein